LTPLDPFSGDLAMPTTDLDTFTEAYIEAALWSSTAYLNPDDDEDEGEPMDDNHTIDDIAPDTLAEMIADCQDFLSIEENGHTVADLIERREGRAGHDFWLTRNGHGSGFWDGDWNPPYVELDDNGKPRLFQRWPTAGDYLTAISEAYGSYDLYIGDDGLIHGQ
jgi:hypothetical protein